MGEDRKINLFIFSVCMLLCVAHSDTDPTDLRVLLEFRNGLKNSYLLNWTDNNDDPCGAAWPYLICTGNRVTKIEVEYLGLRGSLPQNLNELSELTHLRLQGNQFVGSLPTLKGLSKLTIAIFSTSAFDTIPYDFAKGLDNLRILTLEASPLNGTTGWRIPSDLQNSAKLQTLTLVYCNVVGSIPDWLGSMTALRFLKLSNNRISGTIPTSFRGSSLEILWLNDPLGDGLNGTITVLSTMKSLTTALLQNNHFTGTIPADIVDLKYLKELNLMGNQLSGTIPAGLTGLDVLNVTNNPLMGLKPEPKSSKSRRGSKLVISLVISIVAFTVFVLFCVLLYKCYRSRRKKDKLVQDDSDNIEIPTYTH